MSSVAAFSQPGRTEKLVVVCGRILCARTGSRQSPSGVFLRNGVEVDSGSGEGVMERCQGDVVTSPFSPPCFLAPVSS